MTSKENTICNVCKKNITGKKHVDICVWGKNIDLSGDICPSCCKKGPFAGAYNRVLMYLDNDDAEDKEEAEEEKEE